MEERGFQPMYLELKVCVCSNFSIFYLMFLSVFLGQLLNHHTTYKIFFYLPYLLCMCLLRKNLGC